MKTFIKTFCLLSVVYFLAMIYSQWNPASNIWKTNFEIYADPNDDKIDDPPITNSPVPADTIIILPSGEIIIIEE
jgi:hypothetical protein